LFGMLVLGLRSSVESEGAHLVVQVLDVGLVGVLSEGIRGLVVRRVSVEGVRWLLVSLEDILSIGMLGLVGVECLVVVLGGIGTLMVLVGFFRNTTELGQIRLRIHVTSLCMLILGEVVERVVFNGRLDLR